MGENGCMRTKLRLECTLVPMTEWMDDQVEGITTNEQANPELGVEDR
jgi:hypothetical protein